jgi:beta-glucosidase
LDPYPHPEECQFVDGPCREATYSEGLLVGYRWYHASNVVPLFSFGHGLSYTSFQYDNLSIDPSDNTVSFELTNVGSLSGSEVPQLYLSYPDGSGEPPLQLKGFTKVELQPNETRDVQFNLTARSLSVWDLDSHDWSELTGEFSIGVGASSADIRLWGTLQK